MPDFADIHSELARPGVNLMLLWTEYCGRCERGELRRTCTRSSAKYRQWAQITKATMRIQHKPGDAMEVDWAGNTLDIQDPVTGEISKAYLFIADTLQRLAYAEAREDMRLELAAVSRPRLQLLWRRDPTLDSGQPENRSERQHALRNRSQPGYRELAEHYDTTIVPARVEHPKDKPHARKRNSEGRVHIVLALFAKRTFFLHPRGAGGCGRETRTQ